MQGTLIYLQAATEYTHECPNSKCNDNPTNVTNTKGSTNKNYHS